MTTQTLHPASFKFWSSYMIQMRPYLLFISGIGGVTGMVIGYPGDGISLAYIFAGIAFFLSYGFGQALTDTFQMDTDKISAAYRPLSKGIVGKKHVRNLSVIGLLVCAFLIILPNIQNLVFCLLSIMGLATYSFIKRNYWWGGPLYNAWIVALLPVMGYLVTSGGSFSSLLDRDLVFAMLLNFFAYANFVLIGYLKDISADRATGYHTFPVVFGWKKTVAVGTVISIICMIVCTFLITWSIIPFIIFSVASLFSLAGNAYAWLTPEKTEKNASLPIEMTIRSFVLWNMAVVIQFLPMMLLPALLYYVLFETFLKVRPDQSQI